MKKNEFGEQENPKNKINILILCVAIAAVVITGVVYAVKLDSHAEDLGYAKNGAQYCQNENGSIY